MQTKEEKVMEQFHDRAGCILCILDDIPEVTLKQEDVIETCLYDIQHLVEDLLGIPRNG